MLAAALSTAAVSVQAADAAAPAAQAQTNVAADAFIKDITNDVFATVRGDKAIQAGDLRKVIAVIDAKILPHVNFQRMTASAVGKNWRQATPEQQKRLQEEFKNLLIYTYAGAAAQIKDQTVEYRPALALKTPKSWCVRWCAAKVNPSRLTTVWKSRATPGRSMT